MIKIFVIHNNEQDRLGYLVPRLEVLAIGLTGAGHAASIELVGPDVELIKAHGTRHNWRTQTRRAAYSAWMFTAAAMDDPRVQMRWLAASHFLKSFFHHLFSYKRSVKIEQEVTFAHAHSLREAACANDFALVLESDAVLNERTLAGLTALLNYLHSKNAAQERVYVDLAGGGDRDSNVNSWCFQERYGRRDVHLVETPWLTLHILPRLVNNTAGGYLISPSLAADLFNFYMTTRTYCWVVDWAFNVFAARPENKANFLCIHTTPLLFSQGSSSGHYASTIEPGMP